MTDDVGNLGSGLWQVQNVYRVNHVITNLNRHKILPIVKYAINYGFQSNISLFIYFLKQVIWIDKQTQKPGNWHFFKAMLYFE